VSLPGFSTALVENLEITPSVVMHATKKMSSGMCIIVVYQADVNQAHRIDRWRAEGSSYFSNATVSIFPDLNV
jgi:hypothetical protein